VHEKTIEGVQRDARDHSAAAKGREKECQESTSKIEL
jgi:hypothetical protein